jgi:hypothetical protein
LKSPGHALFRDLMGLFAYNIFTVEPHLPCRGFVDTGNNIEKRRFPGSVGTDEPNGRLWVNLDFDMINGRQPAKIDG